MTRISVNVTRTQECVGVVVDDFGCGVDQALLCEMLGQMVGELVDAGAATSAPGSDDLAELLSELRAFRLALQRQIERQDALRAFSW